MNDICPICKNLYSYNDPKIIYHVAYKPENIITNACNNCNYAEYLIRHPEIKTKYNMEWRKKLVKQWTIKVRPQIL